MHPRFLNGGVPLFATTNHNTPFLFGDKRFVSFSRNRLESEPSLTTSRSQSRLERGPEEPDARRDHHDDQKGENEFFSLADSEFRAHISTG